MKVHFWSIACAIFALFVLADGAKAQFNVDTDGRGFAVFRNIHRGPDVMDRLGQMVPQIQFDIQMIDTPACSSPIINYGGISAAGQRVFGPTTGNFVMGVRPGGIYSDRIASAEINRASTVAIWLVCPPPAQLPPLKW